MWLQWWLPASVWGGGTVARPAAEYGGPSSDKTASFWLLVSEWVSECVCVRVCVRVWLFDPMLMVYSLVHISWELQHPPLWLFFLLILKFGKHCSLVWACAAQGSWRPCHPTAGGEVDGRVCVWSSCTGGRQGLEGREDHKEKGSVALGGSGGALGPVRENWRKRIEGEESKGV